ncbi:diaminopimelate epimerase [Maribacter sp. HTCC2170]|uniref:diaminopimelate epimerase n=1 Tax=Maribacter sp. (strain HTCC2170 / KCCM 42371) TaxID=313603 RepID=UPI00006B4714|nr:diaminopimelate epimerase [Maribacter sp. HTCC2170]EAR01548.1 diaminopimelate epimerase [Maribacter sp. HTCC2170]
MQHTFYKYQGTGNDFVMIDNRSKLFPKENINLIARLCDRRFGIGADGLILLENDETVDFKMVYFNSDGNQSSMCGNGGRCLVAFANYLGMISKETVFRAIDGLHEATITNGVVNLKMNNVDEIVVKPSSFFLDTGSPHHVQLVKDLGSFQVFEEGKKIRYGVYGQEGSNINFVESTGKATFAVRTYERGVEDETLSCGTGVTAVAIAMHKAKKVDSNVIDITTKGGALQVMFLEEFNKYSNVRLIGPAKQVFKGEMSW